MVLSVTLIFQNDPNFENQTRAKKRVDLIFQESGRPDSRAEKKGADTAAAAPLLKSHHGATPGGHGGRPDEGRLLLLSLRFLLRLLRISKSKLSWARKYFVIMFPPASFFRCMRPALNALAFSLILSRLVKRNNNGPQPPKKTTFRGLGNNGSGVFVAGFRRFHPTASSVVSHEHDAALREASVTKREKRPAKITTSAKTAR